MEARHHRSGPVGVGRLMYVGDDTPTAVAPDQLSGWSRPTKIVGAAAVAYALLAPKLSKKARVGIGSIGAGAFALASGWLFA